MNGNQYKNNEQILSPYFVESAVKTDWKDAFYKVGIIIAGLLFLFLIILLKSKTTVEFSIEPYLFSYAVFVTTFMLSRIISAMFYEKSFESLLSEGEYIKEHEDHYEPAVAFIIPCKNEERDIYETIRQCHEIDYPSHKFEVIVINDGSTDNTLGVLENIKAKIYPDLKIINWVKNKGKRQAMAAGFEETKAEIVIQLDSDSYIEPVTFRELIAPFRNKNVAAVCASGEPKNANKNIITKMQAAYYFISFRIFKAAESTYDTVFCCSGCCSAYRRKDVMPILPKWLSEKFLGLPVTWGDDRALTSWLLKNNKKTIFSSRAVAYTVVPENLKTLLTQQLRWKKSWIVNFFFTSKFIFKKQPFVSFFYYFPLIFISFLTPIMTFRALIYLPLIKGTLPFYHIAGIILLTSIVVLYYRFIDKANRLWPYLFIWSLFNLFILSFMIVWAAVRIQDRGWGTR